MPGKRQDRRPRDVLTGESMTAGALALRVQPDTCIVAGEVRAIPLRLHTRKISRDGSPAWHPAMAALVGEAIPRSTDPQYWYDIPYLADRVRAHLGDDAFYALTDFYVMRQEWHATARRAGRSVAWLDKQDRMAGRLARRLSRDR